MRPLLFFAPDSSLGIVGQVFDLAFRLTEADYSAASVRNAG
jgi:hypothetical protein